MTKTDNWEVRGRRGRPAVLLVDGVAVDRETTVSLTAGALADLVMSEYRAGKQDGRRSSAPPAPPPPAIVTVNPRIHLPRRAKTVERDAKGLIIRVVEESIEESAP
jgi:hypothetical protein